MSTPGREKFFGGVDGGSLTNQLLSGRLKAVRNPGLYSKMKEKEIKKLFLKWILENEEPDTIAVNEFTMICWKRRVDLLIVNGNIHLVEIKSEKDNLSRLEAQLKYFLKKGHKVTLIADKKHKDKIRYLPNEVGIFWIVDGELLLERPPERRDVHPEILSEYWRLDELRMLFRGIIRKVHRIHVDKLQALLASYPVEVVDKLTCGLLKARYQKYYSKVKINGDLSIPRIAKKGIEDPRKDYAEFFKEARQLLLPYGGQMTFSFV